MLCEDLEKQICAHIKKVLNANNATFWYQLASVNKSVKLVKLTKSYIERNFTSVSYTQQFFNQNFHCFSRIISSSGLNITSELEVFDGIHQWIRYNVEERKKHTKKLLSYLRFDFLSDHEQTKIDMVLQKMSCFHNSNAFKSMINDILISQRANRNSLKLYTKARYCDQSSFGLLTYGQNAISYMKLVNLISCENKIENIENFEVLENCDDYLKACYCNQSVFVVSFNTRSKCLCFKKYCFKTNNWIKLKRLLNCCVVEFSVCAYLENLFLLGGLNLTPRSELNDCIEFNTFTNQLKRLTPFNARRWTAGCAVFEGKIVMSGGHSVRNDLRSVEAYDSSADTWSLMPNMVEIRFGHSLLAVRNKLFAIMGYQTTSCEVYDSFSKKFVLMKSLPFNLKFDSENTAKAVTIGNKVIIFQEDMQIAAVYDMDQNKWSKEEYKSEDSYEITNLVKIPL